MREPSYTAGGRRSAYEHTETGIPGAALRYVAEYVAAVDGRVGELACVEFPIGGAMLSRINRLVYFGCLDGRDD